MMMGENFDWNTRNKPGDTIIIFTRLCFNLSIFLHSIWDVRINTTSFCLQCSKHGI